jgi:hypothetical protein
MVIPVFQIRQKREGHRPECEIMGTTPFPTEFRATPPTRSYRRRSIPVILRRTLIN